MRYILLLSLLLTGSVLAQPVLPSPNDEKPSPFSVNILFASYKPSIYQVRVINAATGQKTSIGSGFVIGDGKMLATNYHVIADTVNKEKHTADYISTDDHEGKLRLLAVDVVHDLAILAADHELGKPFKLGGIPEQGEALYALGNPGDLGFIIVDGINNGILQKSARSRILFSGAINSGMSGGPTVNKNGEVIGVNVESQGNDIGFLVPASHLAALLQQAESGKTNINESIADQLFDDNDKYYAPFFSNQWKKATIGNFTVPTELGGDLRCWDVSPEQEMEDLVISESVVCQTDRTTFISNEMRFGTMGFIYSNVYARDPMLTSRFYHLYGQEYRLPYEHRSSRDFGDFNCRSDFVSIGGKPFKTTYCTQPSKKFIKNDEAVSDLYLIAAQIGEKQKGFTITMMLTGIQENLGKRVMAHILEQITWQQN
ncbi:MAG: serine protease [Cardiobacteriaceae bacterium]|nr:serine protease [Cardiobacteriaceae bacterium]